ncbi:MAG: hypothetical protein ABJD07_14570 [Gemmatimonadaceae bacterium]
MSQHAGSTHELHYPRRADWSPVGAIAPGTLAEARAELHHAAQIANAVGISLLAPRPDDSHTNLEWMPATRSLASELVPAVTPFRAAIRAADLALVLLDETGAPRAQMPLEGATMNEGFAWLVERVRECGADASRMTMHKHYQIPRHALDEGTTFGVGDGVPLRELDRYYGNGDLLLRDLAAREASASPVRCWPHHFDMATLITVRADTTIGVGISPGDESFAEPYFYVSPYPYPPASALPELGQGAWHTTGFTAAVLTATALVRESDGVAQSQLAARFIADAVVACRRALG